MCCPRIDRNGPRRHPAIGVGVVGRAFQQLFAGTQSRGKKRSPAGTSSHIRQGDSPGCAADPDAALCEERAGSPAQAAASRALPISPAAASPKTLPLRGRRPECGSRSGLAGRPRRVFTWLARPPAVSRPGMLRAFNCGIGLMAVVAEKRAGHVIDAFQTCGDKSVRLGPAGSGQQRGCSRWSIVMNVEALSRDKKKVGVLISGRGRNLAPWKSRRKGRAL